MFFFVKSAKDIWKYLYYRRKNIDRPILLLGIFSDIPYHRENKRRQRVEQILISRSKDDRVVTRQSFLTTSLELLNNGENIFS